MRRGDIVERFSPGLDDEIWGAVENLVPVMVADEAGGYIRWADYEALLKKYEELVKELKK